jgi:hypothetical protein
MAFMPEKIVVFEKIGRPRARPMGTFFFFEPPPAHNKTASQGSAGGRQ